jgi:histidinol-phosphate aminotransferase
MAHSRKPEAKAAVMAIKAYVPGGGKSANERTFIQLASNENPLGSSPKVKPALRKAFAQAARYPEGDARDLRLAIAKTYRLDPSRIVCGAGSEQLLAYLAEAYAAPGDEVIQSQYGFLVYRIAAGAAGARVVSAPEKNFTTDADAILARVTPRTKIVFLANPNNPTGTYIPSAAVERLWRALPPHVLLVLDCAYAEYVERKEYDGGIRLVEKAIAEGRDNVALVRTFSKIYGLAGLRLGWCTAPEGVIGALNRVRGAFNVSGPAQAAGIAALSDRAFVKKSRTLNNRELPKVAKRLRGFGLEVPESVGNFVLARFPSALKAGRVYEFLRKRGIIVRPLGPYGLLDCLRITIGTARENKALIRTLETCYCKR